jgi:hypothetical protein
VYRRVVKKVVLSISRGSITEDSDKDSSPCPNHDDPCAICSWFQQVAVVTGKIVALITRISLQGMKWAAGNPTERLASLAKSCDVVRDWDCRTVHNRRENRRV